jgi:7-cyano-7-deazaguanine synthase
MNKEKSIVLLSGGLDSAVNTSIAAIKTNLSLALIFDYKQKCFSREFEAAGKIAKFCNVTLNVVDLPWLGYLTSTSLCNPEKAIPIFLDKLPEDLESLNSSAKDVWVPNRNAIFIDIAAAFAENFGLDLIITGFNAEEGETFPDNSKAFVESINQSLSLSTMHKCRVHSYTIDINKTEIVKLGMEYGTPFEYIYSCYAGDEKMCGICESCKRSIRALKANNIYDKFKGRFKHDN